MVAKTKIKTPEKLLSQLTGAEAANRKHKARIAELEKDASVQAIRVQQLEKALLKALDVKSNESPITKALVVNNALSAVA